MTPFELWLAGKGPEPTIYAPDTSMGDYEEDGLGNLVRRFWRWRRYRLDEPAPSVPKIDWITRERRHCLEQAEAAEEQRAALAQAVYALPFLSGRHPLPDEFRCFMCGVECATKPDDGLAVCEEHCPDHDYVYDPDERRKSCHYCNKPIPLDWYDCE